MNDKLKRLWATKTRDDEWWSSFVTAPLAIVANYGAVDIPWITPNRITAASFLVAIVATFCNSDRGHCVFHRSGHPDPYQPCLGLYGRADGAL